MALYDYANKSWVLNCENRFANKSEEISIISENEFSSQGFKYKKAER